MLSGVVTAVSDRIDAKDPCELMTESEEKYLIDRIIRQEQRRKPERKRGVYCRVRWQRYGAEADSWIEVRTAQGSVRARHSFQNDNIIVKGVLGASAKPGIPPGDTCLCGQHKLSGAQGELASGAFQWNQPERRRSPRPKISRK